MPRAFGPTPSPTREQMVRDSLIRTARRTLARALLVGAALGILACDDPETPTFEVRIIADPMTGNAPLRVRFEGLSRGPLDSVFSYAWDFGDGEQSVEENPEHLFAAPGQYTVSLTVTDETAGGTGAAEMIVDVLPAADLVVSDVVFAPRRLRVGAEMTVSWSVGNRAEPVLGAWEQAVVLSTDAVIDGNDIIIARTAGPEGLSAARAQELTFALLEGVPSGDYRLAVVADPDGRVGDADRTDNTGLAGPEVQVRNPTETGPDLVVCGIAIGAFDMLPMGVVPTAQVSDQLGVEVCLANNGDSPVPLARFAIYLSTDETLDGDDTLVGVRGGLALAPGDRAFSDELVDLSVEPGDYFLFVVADPEEDVDEQQEDNNSRVYGDPIRVVEPGEVEGVDLVITDFQLSGERIFWGQTLGGNLTLVNRGDAPVERFFVVRVSAEPVDGGPSVQIGSLNVPALGAGAEESFELRADVNRRVDEGDYRIVAVADPTNGSGDVNEANNRRTFPGIVTLGGEPDVDASVSGVDFSPFMVDAGSTINVSATVANGGDDSTGALDGIVVLSADAVWGPEDIVVDTFAIDNLDGGARTEIERAVIVPVELDQQIEAWRVAVVIDPDDRLGGERSEENNVAFSPGDLFVSGAMGGCAEDDFEPNDGRGAAALIEAGTYAGLGACDGSDWYQIAVPAGQVVDVAAAWDPGDGALNMRLSDVAGETLQPGEGLPGGAAAFLAADERVRTVLVEITPASFSLQYDLIVALSPVPDGPNLRVRRVTPAPAVAQPGAVVAVNFELVNVGGAAAPESQTAVLTGEAADVSDGVLRGVIDSPALEPGAAAAVQGRVALPDDLADGRYVLAVRADEGDAIDEADEDDNTGVARLRVDRNDACEADVFEPNASPYEEGAVALEAVVEPGEYDGLVACQGDDDWYAVVLQPGQRLTAGIDFDPADGDLEMALYAPDGNVVIDESTGLQGREEVELLRAPAAGIWFVRVYLSGNARSTPYSLDITLAEAEACPDDDFEPNGERAEAALLPDGVHDLYLCPGDSDWFRFAIPAGNTVSWQVSSGQAGVVIRLYDQDGELIDEDDRRIAHLAQYNGLYYLEASVAGAAEVVYQLRVSGVSGVDLSIDELDLSRAAAEPGADLRADVLLSNRRGDPAADVTVRFLLSADEEPSVDDIVVAERILPFVEGAASLRFAQRLALPDDALPGRQFVIAVADPEREIADVRPSNDELATAFEVLAACVDDDLRINESPAGARPLDPADGGYEGGVICPFTEDWFAVLADTPGRVRVTLDFDPAEGDLDLIVLSGFDDYALLAESATEGAPEVVEFDIDGITSLVIGIDGFDDARSDYTLTWELP